MAHELEHCRLLRLAGAPSSAAELEAHELAARIAERGIGRMSERRPLRRSVRREGRLKRNFGCRCASGPISLLGLFQREPEPDSVYLERGVLVIV